MYIIYIAELLHSKEIKGDFGLKLSLFYGAYVMKYVIMVFSIHIDLKHTLRKVYLSTFKSKGLFEFRRKFLFASILNLKYFITKKI